MMLNLRGYMNKLTHKIKRKGYKLNEAIIVFGISLSTYRKYEKEDHPHHLDLVGWVDELEVKVVNGVSYGW